MRRWDNHHAKRKACIPTGFKATGDRERLPAETVSSPDLTFCRDVPLRSATTACLVSCHIAIRGAYRELTDQQHAMSGVSIGRTAKSRGALTTPRLARQRVSAQTA